MSIDQPAALRALLAFYADAGVDTALDEVPANRFIAEFPDRPPAPAAAGSPPRTLYQKTEALGTAGVSPASGEERAARSQVAPNHPAAVPPGRGGSAPPPPDQATMAAREAAASAKSLDELRAMLERFEGCGLRFTAKRLVFADGNPKARVMIVGEAPGRDEDIAGLPFVGRSGQLLDRMIAAIGLDRSKAYIANVIPWRPPGNRTPTPQETLVCLPFIQRQIELVNPDVLVTLGNPSTQALLGTREGIMRTRGKWIDYDTGTRTIRAVATFHPAYLLRSPSYKRMSWQDLRAIAKVLAK